MRIIKKGEIPKQEKKATCLNCKTEFAFTNADVKSDRDGSYVECPLCKKFIAEETGTPLEKPTEFLNRPYPM